MQIICVPVTLIVNNIVTQITPVPLSNERLGSFHAEVAGRVRQPPWNQYANSTLSVSTAECCCLLLKDFIIELIESAIHHHIGSSMKSH
jgi:hypothetical protein